MSNKTPDIQQAINLILFCWGLIWSSYPLKLLQSKTTDIDTVSLSTPNKNYTMTDTQRQVLATNATCT